MSIHRPGKASARCEAADAGGRNARESERSSVHEPTAPSTEAEKSDRIGLSRAGLLLRVDGPPEQTSRRRRCCGDKPAVSPAARRRLVAFQLGGDVVGVVDASSRARATVRVLAGGPRQGAPSKRIGRAERVARLHNLSADVLIANVAAVVRKQRRAGAISGLAWWLVASVAGVLSRRRSGLVTAADTGCVLSGRWCRSLGRARR